SGERIVAMTFQPSLENFFAVAFPIPLDAPVINIVLIISFLLKLFYIFSITRCFRPPTISTAAFSRGQNPSNFSHVFPNLFDYSKTPKFERIVDYRILGKYDIQYILFLWVLN